MKPYFFLSIAMLVSVFSYGQQSPVKWTYEAKKIAAGEYDLVFTAHIQDGWYVYSQYLESDDGPIRTTISYDANHYLQLVGRNAEAGHKIEGYDDLFGMTIIKFNGEPTFTQRVKTTSPTTVSGSLEFMTCDNEKCLPPVDVSFRMELN